MKTRAAVAFEAKQPLEVVELDLDGPRAGEVLVEIRGSGVRPRRPVTAPGRGTVAENAVEVGTYVTAGSLLATAYDLDGVYVTARVPEKEMRDVHVVRWSTCCPTPPPTPR